MKTAVMAAMAVATLGNAHAVFIIEMSPGALPETENILLNNQGLLNLGPVVQGITSDSLLIVDYYGAGEDLIAARARVSAFDGIMNTLSIAPNDPTLGFRAYQFNLSPAADGSATIDLYNSGALVQSATFDVENRGPNFFRLYGTEKETFDEIVVTAANGFASIQQNRAHIVPEPVPEPATLICVGVGLAMLLRRRR